MAVAALCKTVCTKAACNQWVPRQVLRYAISFPVKTCVINSTLAKEAVNAVTEVYADVCRRLTYSVPTWRSDYGAGTIKTALFFRPSTLKHSRDVS